MHDYIFQIATEPISEDAKVEPICYEDYETVFADYIGEALGEAARLKAITDLAKSFSPLFDLEDDVLIVKDPDAFILENIMLIKHRASILSIDRKNLFGILDSISKSIEKTHKQIDSRFFINEWNGWAGTAFDLIEFIRFCCKKGTKLYVGSVVEFHY